MLYSVNEIFSSIQGEGYWAGRAAVFVRFAGCNLKCPWCDTDHSEKVILHHWQILDQVSALWRPGTMIVFTGGEPTIQDLGYLIEYFRPASQYYIAVETNGTNPIPKGFDWITVSPKSPGLYQGDEIKVVLDGKMNPQHFRHQNFKHFYVQPCSENFAPAIDFVKENPKWRLSVQMQKVLSIA